MKEALLYVSIGCIFLLGFSVYLYIQAKKENETDINRIINAIKNSSIQSQRYLDEKLNSNSYFQRRNKELERMIDITESSYTLESIGKFQKLAVVVGISATLLITLFIQNLFISLISLAVVSCVVVYPDFKLRNDLNQKYEEFDRVLPDFISRVSLAMDAGFNLTQAMIVSTRAIQGDIQKEFNRFLADSERCVGNITLPYQNLSDRFPTTSCKRFCSVVITGLKNGNSMKSILKKETEYQNDEILTKMEEQGKKNEVTSTAVSTAFIFLPITVLLIAPIMMQNL